MRQQNPQMRGSWLANASEMVDDVEREALVAGESLPYMANPDRVLGDPLSETELRRAWAEVNDKLTSAFEGFTWEDWLQKHAAVSVEDFIKDPMRQPACRRDESHQPRFVPRGAGSSYKMNATREANTVESLRQVLGQ